MYQPPSPLSGQCERWIKKPHSTYAYVRCRNRAAVERNGQKLCYGCNQKIGAAERQQKKEATL